MYAYFKPSILPEYDSLKQRSITSEFEQLLLKINSLSVFEESAIFESHLTNIKAFIHGSVDAIPSSSASTDPVHQDLYYLLADCYFKSNETSKAVGFYKKDLCIKPQRFDSWAALSLAYSMKLEEDLGLNETAPKKLSISTLRCFKRAMELGESNSKLWIEYGSCTYMLQTTASYLYKLHHLFFMPKLDSPEPTTTTTNEPPINTSTENTTQIITKLQTTPEELLEFKQEMLELSKTCFQEAMKHDCDSEEEWLEHYMIGKMAEKQGEQPSIFLSHYAQVFKHSNSLYTYLYIYS